MKPLDEQFLTLHPRTAQWFSERETCLKCAHCKRGDTALNCKVNKNVYCINAREEPDMCGPDARQFKPK